MTISLKQVIQALDQDEPDYDEAAARLGAQALPHLATLIGGADPGLASKAVALAARINDPGKVALLQAAAGKSDARVRVAAAGAALYLADADASRVLLPLVGDRDVGVQKLALKSVPAVPSAELVAAVQRGNAAISHPALRQLSDSVIRRIAP